jgi:hypothetical protein
MWVGPHDAFSRIAQSNVSSGYLEDLQAVETHGRYTHRVNVRHCVDLALGIVRFDCLGRSKVFILGPGADFNTAASSEVRLIVRRNLTHLTWGQPEHEELYDIANAANYDFGSTYGATGVWQCPFPGGPENSFKYRPSMNVAIIIRKLHPWGLIPVFPETFRRLLIPLLKNLQPATSTELPILIQNSRKSLKRCLIFQVGPNLLSMQHLKGCMTFAPRASLA